MKEKNKVYKIKIKSFIINTEKNPINNKELKRFITKIFKYSAIKIRANVTLLYSVLNPDTNSDSPSAKSKGVRLVSANIVVNHTKNKGKNKKKIPKKLYWKIKLKFKLPKANKHLNKINDILTSYEIVWAIPRKAPNKEYFELEVHPAANVV